jgi:hypothetical protein
MAIAREVLAHLIPNGGYVLRGETFEDIEFIEATPITKAEFEAGFAAVDALKAETIAKTESDKAAAEAKLSALGLTADDLKALGLGNN